ncbi:hypothetical protein BJV74DRAFT_885219 [Russula compacta]|nr:hypothetical protein BJV74DRAFT_885219 [Russula compacta]
MEARDIENLNLSQGFGEPPACIVIGSVPLVAWTDRRRIGDWQSQDLYIPSLPAPRHQTTHFDVLDAMHLEPWSWVPTSELAGLSPGQIPETGSHLTPVSDRSHGNFWDEIRVFQIHVNGSRPNLHIADQDVSLRPTEDHLPGLSAYSQFIRGNNARLCDPNRCSNVLHGQPSGVSPQQLEYGTYSISPFQHHPGQTIDSEFTRPPRVLEAEAVHRGKGAPQEWFCRDCGKNYGRRQELKRHRRDNHERPRKCPICGSKWTRADMIRSHLITWHKDQFSEEERRKICHLRGLIDTIHFLEGAPYFTPTLSLANILNLLTKGLTEAD